MKQEILLFEYYLLAAQLFEKGFSEEARQRATGASSAGQTDTWHDEVFKLELIQKTIQATLYDQLQSKLRSPRVILPDLTKGGKKADIGSVITIAEESYPEEEYLLTGDTVAPSYGLITVKSPLGNSLLGATPSSMILVNTPTTSTKIKVVDVSYDISNLLMRYLGHIFDNAVRQLREKCSPEIIIALADKTKRIESGHYDPDVERDYYQVITKIESGIANLEAITLIIDTYKFSTELYQNCKDVLAEYSNLFETSGIRIQFLKDAPYCNPRPDQIS